MKLYVKANSNVGYLYIFKHGTGPGTVPRDVVFLKEKDLPNGYTAVWLDRFLKTSELRAYDIPSETEINKYLDRIGYCQKDGDVVPCDEVEACDKVTSAIMLDDEDSEHIASQVENELRITCRDDGNYIYIFSDEDGVKSPFSYTELNGYYTRLLKNGDYHRFKPVKKSIQYFEDKIMELTSSSNSDEEFKDNYRNFLINFLGLPSVEACDKVTASSQSITSLMSPYADALTNIGYDGKKFLNEVSSEYTYDELSDADDLHACICGFILNSDYINQEDASKLADNVISQVGNINACDTKYFANMVSASNDPELDDNFLIEGYYDNQRRGLAESAETSDVSALNELANEYANKGYYIVVYNLTDGVITEFSADNWFNDIAPDGGASLFMSW